MPLEGAPLFIEGEGQCRARDRQAWEKLRDREEDRRKEPGEGMREGVLRDRK